MFYNNDSQPEAILLPRGHLAMYEDILLVVTTGDGKELLASSVQKLDMLLNRSDPQQRNIQP